MLAKRRTLETAIDRRPYDPYAAWNRWCEGPATPCQKDADCKPDRTGRAQRCYLPYWAKTKDAKVCAIPRMRKGEREAMKAHLQRIVVAISGRRGRPEQLGAWIGLVAMRETSLRPWKQHRMSGDVKLAQTTWAKRYRELAPVNPYYADSDRFQGWGLLGQQWTFALAWDRAAPPEILCRPVVAIETYLHCARRTHIKQTSMGITPTWETLHGSCSGGNVRPKGPSQDFRKRARRVGLDPEQPVRMEWLGVSPGKNQLERNLTLGLIEATVAHR
jgi:hypothetical protein